MCAVLHTSPHAVPRPRAAVADDGRSLAMLGTHSELSSRPVHPGRRFTAPSFWESQGCAAMGTAREAASPLW